VSDPGGRSQLASSGFELVRLQFHEVAASPGLERWLAEAHVSMALTSGGRVFLAGLRADGSLSVTDCQYGLCTALEPAGPDTLYLATRFQIWRLENALPAGQLTESGNDRLFVPQTAWTTGLLGVHDLALDGAGDPVFVSDRFSCLCGLSETLNFEPRWAPPFVSALVAEDRCHLTGVALRDGRPAYVTCAARTDTNEGWRQHKRDGGVVVDVASGEIVCTGLSLPHSPRLRGEQLWLANGGRGEIGFVDLTSGRYEPVASVPGFARGLAFSGRFAVVGTSKPPREESFEGLALHERLERDGAAPVCGVFVVDVDAGRVEHSLVLNGGAPEVYDVALLDARAPAAVAIQGDDIQDLVTIPC
jgi:uncharacterized protein (TIGR03032 family)